HQPQPASSGFERIKQFFVGGISQAPSLPSAASTATLGTRETTRHVELPHTAAPTALAETSTGNEQSPDMHPLLQRLLGYYQAQLVRLIQTNVGLIAHNRRLDEELRAERDDNARLAAEIQRLNHAKLSSSASSTSLSLPVTAITNSKELQRS